MLQNKFCSFSHAQTQFSNSVKLFNSKGKWLIKIFCDINSKPHLQSNIFSCYSKIKIYLTYFTAASVQPYLYSRINKLGLKLLWAIPAQRFSAYKQLGKKEVGPEGRTLQCLWFALHICGAMESHQSPASCNKQQWVALSVQLSSCRKTSPAAKLHWLSCASSDFGIAVTVNELDVSCKRFSQKVSGNCSLGGGDSPRCSPESLWPVLCLETHFSFTSQRYGFVSRHPKASGNLKCDSLALTFVNNWILNYNWNSRYLQPHVLCSDIPARKEANSN